MTVIDNFDLNLDRDRVHDYIMDFPGGCAVTMGKFDGIHLGHRKLMQAIVNHKDITSGENGSNGDNSMGAVAIAFGNAPHKIAASGMHKLTTKEERRYLLQDYGIDLLIEFPFTEEFRNMRAYVFTQNVLQDLLHSKFVVVGSDFRFGRNREGDTEFLKRQGLLSGFYTGIVEKETYKGEDISSTRILKALESGDLTLANQLLGHDYPIMGKIVSGKRLGRTIGFPTINIWPEPAKILPANGVYASRVHLPEENRYYDAITNIGLRPTVEEDSGRINTETHLFDCDDDLYGKNAVVFLKEFIRPEMRFSGVEELSAQIASDKEKAIQILR